MSILRAGEVLEPAIQLVCKDVKYGKILIQTSEETGEPQVRRVHDTGFGLHDNCWIYTVTFCAASY